MQEVERNIKNDNIAKGLLASKDGTALLFYFNNQPLGNKQAEVIDEWESIIYELKPHCDVYILGAPFLIKELNFTCLETLLFYLSFVLS